jgi:signal transduction histidine kinase
MLLAFMVKSRQLPILIAILLTAMAGADPVELTKVAEVRALSRADEVVEHPVRLQGVIISDSTGEGIFLQDDTASIWLKTDRNAFQSLKRGDLVEVRGVSSPSRFAPIVMVTMVVKKGTAPITPPVRVTFEDLESGRYDAQSVEIEGIVRSAAHSRLDLETGGGRLPLLFADAQDRIVPIDGKIRVWGIALYQFTRSGQTMRPVLAVLRGVKPTILTPPPKDIPLLHITKLMAFSDKLDQGHRVRIRGVVTHRQPGEAVWLEDMGHGIRVKLTDTNTYALGEALEVTGFPVRGANYSPEMEDVTITRIGYGAPPPPKLLQSSLEALDHDAGLITLDAEVVKIMRVPTGLRFVLRDKHRDFIASLGPNLAVIPPDWEEGSLFRVTGISSVSSVLSSDSLGAIDPREFELIVRSPADIQVLQTPPWWNAQRLSRLFGAIALVLGIAVLAIIGISRRGLRQAAIARRQSEAEFSAILSERNRIAREIHDTLAQGLGAISLHLDMMKDHVTGNSKAASHLTLASEITRECLGEARQSIWNMRSQVIEENGLDGALAGVYDQLTDIDGLEGGFEVTGEPFRLPPIVENNLLRIGQEAITNAIKHAAAKHIDVAIIYSPQLVTIRVKDDGSGFDPAAVRGENTHFGLQGLKERTHEIGAAIRVESSPGHGTEVILEYPVRSSNRIA